MERLLLTCSCPCHIHAYTDDGVRPMSLALWGGPAPKGDAAWGGGGSGDEDQGAGIWLQACNAPLVALLQSAAFGARGAMQYKAIQVLYWAGCVYLFVCVFGCLVVSPEPDFHPCRCDPGLTYTQIIQRDQHTQVSGPERPRELFPVQAAHHVLGCHHPHRNLQGGWVGDRFMWSGCRRFGVGWLKVGWVVRTNAHRGSAGSYHHHHQQQQQQQQQQRNPPNANMYNTGLVRGRAGAALPLPRAARRAGGGGGRPLRPHVQHRALPQLTVCVVVLCPD